MRKGLIAASAALIAVGAAATAAPAAAADPVADFYKGKRMKFIIGFGTGGGYNLYSRHVARHMGKHIPGKPNFIAQNMTGAGSIRASNFLYSRAPKDGTVIGMISQAIPLAQLLKYKGVDFDIRKFNWIGNASVSIGVTTAYHKAPFKTLEDAKKNEMILPATGGRSTSTIVPRVMNAILGTKFKIIQGFQGAGQMNLAMERGEVHGRGSNTLASWAATAPEWVANNRIIHLVQYGPHKDPRIPNVPLLQDLAANDEDRGVLELVSAMPAVGRPITAPPDVPPARVAALRAAFDATMKDAAYIAEAKKLKMELNPTTGAKLTEVIKKIMEVPAPVLVKFKEAIKFGQTYKCTDVMADKKRCRKAKKKKNKKKAS
jgi:tripartite-type tricarboxylate transporter receptor subunit TctC